MRLLRRGDMCGIKYIRIKVTEMIKIVYSLGTQTVLLHVRMNLSTLPTQSFYFYQYWDLTNIVTPYEIYNIVLINCIIFSENKTVLTNVSGLFCRNQVSAIIGCSGCGKSTLMNILSGYM